MIRRQPFAAVNLISDPIHGYIELTKRLEPDESAAAGLPDEEVAEEDLLDTAWLQRLRRISQLQSARWVFPTAEHSRFTHGLGVMHEAGLWARSLYPSLRTSLATAGEPQPSEGLVVETLRMAGLLHDVGHGPFAHFFDDHVLAAFDAPADVRRPTGKRLTHEDLSGLIIDQLGPLLGGLRRAPGAVAERDAFADGETVDPAWVSFLVSKPALADPAMPRWVRWLQPLLSGVFTVDNLDYVRRDAYLTGVSVGPVEVERLRRYTFVSERGLTLFEPGLPALEMFLTSRRFMYQQVYFHRTVRAIDLDLGEVFGPSIRAIFGEGSPADRLGSYADLDEYGLLHQAARWARGEAIAAQPTPGDGTVTRAIGEAWQAILLRRPTWRSEAEIRAEYEAGGRPAALVASLGVPDPGHVAIDLAEVDARPADAASTDGLLALETRDGGVASLSAALASIPAYWLIGRRYRRRP
ncbi:MAG TPA: HD domain-containing protein [Candidatus Limnocylindrales bacterium]|jgi:HD superfamily phosphohydrolase|nr:HD domain-containing protein [Candidatus Limnocylindrales bacterium]